MSDIRTYRASSLQEALELVRRDLGPDAAVLHTRESEGTMWRWLTGEREIEVVASTEVAVPSRWQPGDPMSSRFTSRPAELHTEHHTELHTELHDEIPSEFVGQVPTELPPAPLPAKLRPRPEAVAPAEAEDYKSKFREDLQQQAAELEEVAEQLWEPLARPKNHNLPPLAERVASSLMATGVDLETAQRLAREAWASVHGERNYATVRDQVARRCEDELPASGPITLHDGERRIVAVVGPTGVGKTTTIAKLAAHYRLREKRRVGLITVDTYRVAAVEQLRTYAEIIDLPLEVVSTPREMREALSRSLDLDLVLIDTAGRSPRDEVQIQELRSLLAEARPDEVLLAMSSVCQAAALTQAARRFAEVGVTGLVLTKLDEVETHGHWLPLVCQWHWPVRYLACGQHVPRDLLWMDRKKLVRTLLGMETVG